MSDVAVRNLVAEDIEPLGEVVFEAFRDIAAAHGFRPAFSSPEQARLLLNTFRATELATMVTAMEGAVPAGAACMNIRGEAAGIGPVAVSPSAQADGIGRAMMTELLRRADDAGCRSVSLTQATYNVVSFSLYSKLGFVVRDTFAHLEGRLVAPEIDTGAVRLMRPDETDAAAALDTHLTGFRRAPDFALLRNTGPAWVVERDGEMRGFLLTLGLGEAVHLGPASAEDDESLIALIAAAGSEMADTALAANVVVSQPAVLRWMIEHGMRVEDLGTWMVRGEYAPPRGSHLRGIAFPEGL